MTIPVSFCVDVQRTVVRSVQLNFDVQIAIKNSALRASVEGLRIVVREMLAPLVAFFCALANILNSRGQIEESNAAMTVAGAFLLIALKNLQDK